MSEFTRSRGEGTVLVRTEHADELARQLTAAGGAVRLGLEGSLIVSALDSAEIGRLASFHGVALSELTPQAPSLEDVFMEMTRDSVEYEGAAA
jgi:ABC-2 type transport system ATP-binding protein